MLPFDWRAPLSYLVAWFIQLAANFSLNLSVIPFFILMFASSWLFVAITDEITQELTAFNNNIKILAEKNHGKLIRCLCDIIQLYSNAKQ